MISKIFFTIFFLFASVLLFAQETQDRSDHSALEHDHEHDHIHEIGVSVAPVYFFNEKELSSAVHAHYTYNFPHTKFGLGLAYEHIFDEHRHNFIGLEGAYRPFHPLTLNVTPGITFEGADPGEKQFAIHFETVYEFEIGRFHLGPVFEFAYHKEDYHISLGVHIGMGF